MRADGTHVRRLTTFTKSNPYYAEADQSTWSPDGKRLVFELRNTSHGRSKNHIALYVVNADGTGLHRLTPRALNGGDHADWSPDGSLIVFVTHPGAIPERPGGNVYTIHPDGTGLTQLTHFGRDEWTGRPVFSPDGQLIAFGHTRPRSANADVYVMGTDGTNITPVTHTPQWESSVAWARVR